MTTTAMRISRSELAVLMTAETLTRKGSGFVAPPGYERDCERLTRAGYLSESDTPGGKSYRYTAKAKREIDLRALAADAKAGRL